MLNHYQIYGSIMENFLSIYLPPDTDLTVYGFRVPMYEWAGEQYPQGPMELNYKNEYKIHPNDLHRGLRHRCLPAAMKVETWVRLDLHPYGVGTMEEVFLCKDEEKNENDENTLKGFFRHMLGKNKYWVICYDIDERLIQQSYSSEIYGVIPILKQALEDEKGVIVYSNDLYNTIQA